MLRGLSLRLLALGVAGLLGAGDDACAQGADIVAAQSDLAVMQTALDLVFIDTGFYTSLENLNDTRSDGTAPRPYDGINNGGGTLVLRLDTGLWNPTRRNLLTGSNQWQGPYIGGSSFSFGTDGVPAAYDVGSPIDPWGNPYYLFTPRGLALPATAEVSATQLYGDAFDRWAVVSLGRDGVVSNDDLLRLFGDGSADSNPTPSASRATFTPAPGRARSAASGGGTLEVRGYRLGDSATGRGVLVNGAETSTTISLWSAARIEALLPTVPPPGATVAVRLGPGQTTAPVAIDFLEPPSAAVGWDAYD